MMSSIVKRKTRRSFYGVLGTFLMVLGWIAIERLVDNPFLIPSVSAVLTSLIEIFTQIEAWVVVWNTVARLLVSVGIAFSLGMVFLVLTILKEETALLLRPLVTVFKTVPVASIIIVLLVWFGSDRSPLVITTLVIFPIMFESFLTGLQNIRKSYLEELKMNGGITPYAIARVYIPIIRPFLFMGLIQSMGLGIKVMVMAELISQTRDSIGNMLYLQKIHFNMAGVFAWTIVLVLIVVLIEHLIHRIKNKLTP